MGKKLTVEDACEIIDNILDKAEDKFHNKHNRFPSMLVEEDYVLLADHLNLKTVWKGYTYMEDGNERYALESSDVAYNLLKRTIQRECFFNSLGEDQKTAIDGFMGRVMYNFPCREYKFRADKLDELISKNLPFPKDFYLFAGTLANASKICFLPTIYSNIYFTPLGKKNKKGYENIGTHLVNPSAHIKNIILMRLQDICKKDEVPSFEAYRDMWLNKIHDQEWSYYL